MLASAWVIWARPTCRTITVSSTSVINMVAWYSLPKYATTGSAAPAARPKPNSGWAPFASISW